MRVAVRYFAVLRDRRGLDSEVIEIEPMSAGALAAGLIETHKLGLPPSLVRVAVNGAFVEDSQALSDGDEVVMIPPVAGG